MVINATKKNSNRKKSLLRYSSSYVNEYYTKIALVDLMQNKELAESLE